MCETCLPDNVLVIAASGESQRMLLDEEEGRIGRSQSITEDVVVERGNGRERERVRERQRVGMGMCAPCMVLCTSFNNG